MKPEDNFLEINEIKTGDLQAGLADHFRLVWIVGPRRVGGGVKKIEKICTGEVTLKKVL